MSVNHRGTHITMAKKLLHGSNIVAVLQQMRRKSVPSAAADDNWPASSDLHVVGLPLWLSARRICEHDATA
jgi:hypothetical protein